MSAGAEGTPRPLTQVGYFVLEALSEEPLHDYGIIRSVWKRTGGKGRLEAATLFAAIRRLRADGLIERDPGVPREGPLGRRDYLITESGRRVFADATARIERLRGLAPRADP